MPRFKKVVLGPGTYKSPDGEISITPARIRHWRDQFKQMKDFGLNIPSPWGHLSSAYPDYETKEFFESKYNAGFIDSFEMDDKDQLVAVLDIPREEDANRIGTTVREVSPQIETEWRDGKGRIWNDVITHLALVTHPVVPGQNNFEPMPENAVRLSLSMRINKMADKDTKKDETKKVDKKPETKKVEETVYEPPDTSDGSVSEGEVDSELLEVLEQVGLVLPDDTTTETLPSRLKAAAMTLYHKMQEIGEGGGGGGDDKSKQDLEALLGGAGQQPPPTETPDKEDTTNTPSPDTKPETTQEQPAAMTMSLNKEIQNYKTRLSLLEKGMEDSNKTRMKTEIKLLLEEGKVSPVIAQKLTSKLSTYRLSLNDKGEQTSEIQDQIDLLKLMPIGGAWTSEEKVRLRNASEQDLPMEFTSLGDEASEKLAEEQLKVCGRSLTFNF